MLAKLVNFLIVPFMPLTPPQCRAARGLLDWTQDELAERAGVSRGTVRGFEAGRHELRKTSAADIRAALEAGGVLFLDPDADRGPGVCLGSWAALPIGESLTSGSAQESGGTR
jgi:transcriptional regulator with XRE-family HTH domain